VLFTPEWSGMVFPMQLLAISYALGTLNLLPGTIYKAINRTEYLLRISLINLPCVVVLLALAVPRGIDATAVAQVIIVIVAYAPNQVLLHRVIGISLRATLSSLVPGLFCAAATAAAGLAAQRLVSAPDLAELAFAAAASLAGYLVALRLAGPEVFAEASRFLVAKRRAA
jgi:O-antigen/teichoic acid export membrane protein